MVKQKLRDDLMLPPYPGCPLAAGYSQLLLGGINVVWRL